MPLLLYRAGALLFAGAAAIALAASADRASPVACAALVALALLAAWRPSKAALLVAAFAPLGAALAVVTGIVASWSTLLQLGALAGWSARIAVAGAVPTDTPFTLWSGALAVVALASGLALTGGGFWATVPAETGVTALMHATWTGLVAEGSALSGAVRFAVPVLSAVWIGDTVRRDPASSQGILRMLVLSASALGAISIYRLVEVAIRHDAGPGGLFELVRTLRLTPLVADVNALGSLFLLVFPVALDWSLDRQTRGRGLVALALVIGGAVLAGSRVSLALLPLATLAVLAWRRRPTARLVLAGGLVACGALTLILAVPSARHVGASTAWSVRKDMGVVTARMLYQAPLFGVGQGRFAEASTTHMPATLRGFYTRENAHNQFLQVAGELGLLGAVALAGVLGLIVAPVVLGWGLIPQLAGLAAGVLTFLVSWLGQHPLLEPHVAATFWIAAGLLRGQVVTPPAGRHWLSGLAVVLILATLAGLPIQTAFRAADVDLSGTFAHTSRPVRDDPGGAPFWRIAREGSVYLPGRAAVCAFQLRARGIFGETEVTLWLDHQPAGRVRVARGEWRAVELVLPRPAPWPIGHHRLDLAWVPDALGRVSLDVTRPECRDAPSGPGS